MQRKAQIIVPPHYGRSRMLKADDRCRHRFWNGREWEQCGTGFSATALLATLEGRPPASGGPYCEKHGGRSRAVQEAREDWNWIAPEHVGDADAVHRAGLLHLSSPDAYLVVRRDRDGKQWLAYLGLGSSRIQVWRPGCEGKGAGTFATEELALQAATDEWRRRIRVHLAEIKEARGGSFSWGEPIRPLVAPVLILLEAREREVEVAARTPRVEPTLLRFFRHRASGELA